MSTWLGHRVPRYLVKYDSGCFCERWFCMWLIFKLVKWVKQFALPNVGGLPLIKGQNKKKKSYLPQIGEYSTRLTAFELRHQFFPAFCFRLKHWLFLGLQTGIIRWFLLVLRLLYSGWDHTISSPGSPFWCLALQAPKSPWDLSAFVITWVKSS